MASSTADTGPRYGRNWAHVSDSVGLSTLCLFLVPRDAKGGRRSLALTMATFTAPIERCAADWVLLSREMEALPP